MNAQIKHQPMKIAGFFECEHYRHGDLLLPEQKLVLPRKGDLFQLDAWVAKNIVTDEGLNHILNVQFNGATQVATWYLGTFEGNYTPVAGDTAATFPASATECTAYDEAARPAFVEATSSAKSITNTASPAVFTYNATKTIYGAFLTSIATKSSTAGTLFAAAKFAASRAVVDNDVLNVRYTVNAA
jgi:hypothetical protein